MHPTAAALALLGCWVVRHKNLKPRSSYQFMVVGPTMAYLLDSEGNWQSAYGIGAREAPGEYNEIAWSDIPDSLWTTCDVNEAVRILGS